MQREHEKANMKHIGICFNSVTANLIRSSFVRKSAFYCKNIQYVYNFYGTELYVNVCRCVFRTQPNTNGGDSFQKTQESFIADVWLGSKYASGIDFIVEKV